MDANNIPHDLISAADNHIRFLEDRISELQNENNLLQAQTLTVVNQSVYTVTLLEAINKTYRQALIEIVEFRVGTVEIANTALNLVDDLKI